MDGDDDSDGVEVEAADFLRSNAPRDDDFDDMRESTARAMTKFRRRF
jgi:hypothetical protein